MTRLGLTGGLLLALTLWALSLHQPGTGAMDSNSGFVAIAATSAAVYLASVWLILKTNAPPLGIWVVLLVAAALRLPLVLADPFLSSDIYRYVWDGRVQMAGINPYRYIPMDAALAALRDTAIYPHINRADYAVTVYPPAAQMVFALGGALHVGVTGFKTMMLGFDVLAIVCLLRLLALAGLPPARCLIYAWNPVPVWAFAGNGHVDAMVAGLIAAALLARAGRRDVWTGFLLGAAVATKFLPAVIAPALWQCGAGWRTAIAATVTILVLYTVYSSVGLGVFGFLGSYGQEEGLTDGGGIWLLAGLARFGPLPALSPPVYLAAALAVLGALSAWIAFVRRPDDPVALCGSAGLLMAALAFALSPHYPWYYAWLAVPAVLAPNRALLWLATAPILLYDTPPDDYFVWPSLVFVPALLLTLADLHRPLPHLAPTPIKGNT